MSSQTRLAEFVPYLMSVTTNAVSDLIAGEYRAIYGLKIPEWRVMAILGDSGAKTQRDLVDATRMDKVAVNRACKVLEDRKLACRRPNDSDGRSHILELTASGKAMHGKIMPHALEMESKLLAPLSLAEQAQFVSLLNRIGASAEILEEGKKAK
jgi:DNA-binding MarR family transcriptional regulator